MTKPLLRVLRGESLWPPPLWLMRQAGRYLPEYRAVRAEAGDFLALATTPALAAEVTLQPIRRFGMDGAILFSDILILPWALGHGLRFAEGEGPVMPKLEPDDIGRLRLERLEAGVAPVLEAVRRVRAALAAEAPGTALIGFAGAPFTVACYMVDGGGGKDFPRTRTMAYADPDAFSRLIALLTEATIAYLAAQIEAGAEAVMLFDSWAGLLAPRLFAAHVIAPAARIFAALKQRFPAVPLIGFPRLAGTALAAYAGGTAADAIGLDTACDPRVAAAAVAAPVALQGNLDPLALCAGGAALTQETASVLRALRGRAHVFNLGHGIVPATPPEHVAALVGLVRNAERTVAA